MGVQAPPELIGIHTNQPGAVPSDVFKAAVSGGPAPSGLSDEERNRYEKLKVFWATDVAYALQMATRPQTLYGIADSPVGLAAWIIDHDLASYELIARVFDGQVEGLTRDDVLDNISLFWLTNTGISAAPSVLGKQIVFLRTEGRVRSGGGQHLSRRDRCRSAQLGRAGLSQSHLLQQGPQGRALRRLGTAETLRRRTARGL
jgi:hypothetical protein